MLNVGHVPTVFFGTKIWLNDPKLTTTWNIGTSIQNKPEGNGNINLAYTNLIIQVQNVARRKDNGQREHNFQLHGTGNTPHLQSRLPPQPAQTTIVPDAFSQEKEKN